MVLTCPQLSKPTLYQLNHFPFKHRSYFVNLHSSGENTYTMQVLTYTMHLVNLSFFHLTLLILVVYHHTIQLSFVNIYSFHYRDLYNSTHSSPRTSCSKCNAQIGGDTDRDPIWYCQWSIINVLWLHHFITFPINDRQFQKMHIHLVQ